MLSRSGPANIPAAAMAAETAEPKTPKEWPDHFPPGCPPADAHDLSGIVYMLVATDPPTPEDMECAIDRKSFIGKPEVFPCISILRERRRAPGFYARKL